MSWVSRFARFAVAVMFVGLVAQRAEAAGVRASGSASTTEWKSPPSARAVRARALRRARLVALQGALEALAGPVDADAKAAVLREGTRWTGAYRILAERVGPQEVHVDLEVDIDVARLAKYVAPARTPAQGVRFHVDAVRGDRGCVNEAEQVTTDLERLGVAVAPVGTSAPVTVAIECAALGPVPNTLLHAVELRLEARAGGRSLLSIREAAFGNDEASARARGAAAIADLLATALSSEPDGVVVRVELPHPASRVRRLQRAMVDQVQGIRGAELVGIDPDGAARLRVRGTVSADGLARDVQALSLPDFSITIVGVDEARGLTVRLR